MNLHEYQSKELFAGYAIPVPKGEVAGSPDSVVAAAKALGGLVKAQIHSGGRGKAGGVKLVKDLEAVRAAAMLETTLVTHQTGPDGLTGAPDVRGGGFKNCARDIPEFGAEPGCRSPGFRRGRGRQDIEEVAEHSPEKIMRINVNSTSGLQDSQCRQLAFGLGVNGIQTAQFGKIAQAIHELYLEQDAGLVEVNPLIVTAGGDLLAPDAKICGPRSGRHHDGAFACRNGVCN